MEKGFYFLQYELSMSSVYTYININCGLLHILEENSQEVSSQFLSTPDLLNTFSYFGLKLGWTLFLL